MLAQHIKAWLHLRQIVLRTGKLARGTPGLHIGHPRFGNPQWGGCGIALFHRRTRRLGTFMRCQNMNAKRG